MVKKKGDLHKKDPIKVLHPNSRKAVRLSKNTNKQQKRLRAKMTGNVKQQAIAKLLDWVQDFIEDYPDPFTASNFLELLECYFHRHDDEMEEIDEKNSIGGYRKGRQNLSRETALRDLIEKETRDFNSSGLEFPDLLSKNGVVCIRQWDGDVKSIHNVPLKRVKKQQLEALAAREAPARKPSEEEEEAEAMNEEDA